MNNLSTGRNIFRGRFLLLLGACLGIYFSYHAIAGQRSVVSLFSLRAELAQADQKLAELSTESNILHKKVVMLRLGTLDADYVEELAAHYLGYNQSSVITVLYDGR